MKGGSKPDRIADSESAVGVIPRMDKGCTRDGGCRMDSHHIPRQTKQGMERILHQKPLEGEIRRDVGGEKVGPVRGEMPL